MLGELPRRYLPHTFHRRNSTIPPTFFSQYEYYDLSLKISNILQLSMIYAVFRIEFTELPETSRKINCVNNYESNLYHIVFSFFSF